MLHFIFSFCLCSELDFSLETLKRALAIPNTPPISTRDELELEFNRVVALIAKRDKLQATSQVVRGRVVNTEEGITKTVLFPIFFGKSIFVFLFAFCTDAILFVTIAVGT